MRESCRYGMSSALNQNEGATSVRRGQNNYFDGLICQVHDYKEGTPEEKTYYIELWDVGGSVGSASSVKSTRAVFYNSVNGKAFFISTTY